MAIIYETMHTLVCTCIHVSLKMSNYPQTAVPYSNSKGENLVSRWITCMGLACPRVWLNLRTNPSVCGLCMWTCRFAEHWRASIKVRVRSSRVILTRENTFTGSSATYSASIKTTGMAWTSWYWTDDIHSLTLEIDHKGGSACLVHISLENNLEGKLLDRL